MKTPKKKFLHFNGPRSYRLAFCLIYMANEVRNILFVLLGNIIGGGLLISFFDGKPILDGLYLAFITSLTVGYGDLSPETGFSKVIAIGIGLNGLLLTGIVIAIAIKALELSFDQEAYHRLHQQIAKTAHSSSSQD